MRFGSTLYGTNTLNSDTDYKSIYVPSIDDYLLQSVKKTIENNTGTNSSRNTKDDVDNQLISLNYFLQLCISGDTLAIDMLHAPEAWEEITSPIWEDLKSKRHLFYTKNLKSYLGYCKKQASKYSIKGSRLDTAEKIISWCKTTIEENTVKRSTSFEAYLKLKGYAVGPIEPSKIPLLHKAYEQSIQTGKLFPKGLKLYSVIKSLPNLPHIEKIENGILDDYFTLIPDNASSFVQILEKKFFYTSYVEDVLKSLTSYNQEYGERAKQAQENLNIDWKAVSHAFRAGFQIKEILETGDLKFPLKDRRYLSDMKQGKLHWINDQIPDKLDSLLEDVKKLSNDSSVPEQINDEMKFFWDNWLLTSIKSLYTL